MKFEIAPAEFWKFFFGSRFSALATVTRAGQPVSVSPFIPSQFQFNIVHLSFNFTTIELTASILVQWGDIFKCFSTVPLSTRAVTAPHTFQAASGACGAALTNRSICYCFVVHAMWTKAFLTYIPPRRYDFLDSFSFGRFFRIRHLF
jgi:hypothetical protein